MKKSFLKKTAIIFFWILLWQLAALLIHNPIYFASPSETVSELVSQAGGALFWRSVGGSLFRIFGGFAAAAFTAFVLAFAACGRSFIEDMIKPVVAFLKSVPVAAVVVILLIWWGTKLLVLCIAFMVVFPGIYENVLTGLKKTDRSLLEMAKVYRMGWREKFLWIRRFSYRPYLISATEVSLGMAFKSGVAAEIIGLPKNSIGEQLYRDKIYLNTAGVFAWIIVILLLSYLSERFILYIIKQIARCPEPCPTALKRSMGENETGSAPVVAEGIRKCYDGRVILDTSVKLEAGRIYCLSAPSGSGKTTLFKILAGIIPADGGRAKALNVSMVFQEDRLIPEANALRNLQAAGCRGDIAGEIGKLLPAEVAAQPVGNLSGGEKRRVAVLRALMHPSDVLIMDEPFTGLDAQTKHKLTETIKAKRGGRTLIIASHDGEDAKIFGAQRLTLECGVLKIAEDME